MIKSLINLNTLNSSYSISTCSRVLKRKFKMADYSAAYNPYASDAYGAAYKGSTPASTSGTGLDKKLNMLLFGAACIVVLSGALALMSFLLEPWAVFDIMNEVFLVVFGAVLFVLHAPLNFKWIMDYKAGISKYCRLLTRFTGLGMYLLFLGCLVSLTSTSEFECHNLIAITTLLFKSSLS